MNKLYKVLYSLSIILIIIIVLIISSKISIFGLNNTFYFLIIPVLYMLFITYSLIKMFKNREYNSSRVDIVFISLYYLFMLFLFAVFYLLNKGYSKEYMIISAAYYFALLLIPDLILRIYTVLLYSGKSNK